MAFSTLGTLFGGLGRPLKGPAVTGKLATGLPIIKGPAGGPLVRVPIPPVGGPAPPLNLKVFQLQPGPQPGLAIDLPGANMDSAQQQGMQQFKTDDAYSQGFQGVVFQGAKSGPRTVLLPGSGDGTVYANRPKSFEGTPKSAYLEFRDLDILGRPAGGRTCASLNLSAGNTNQLRPMVAKFVRCRLLNDPNGPAPQFGLFTYQTTLVLDATEILILQPREHLVYMHGFGGGPEFGFPPGLYVQHCIFYGEQPTGDYTNQSEGLKLVNRPHKDAYAQFGIPPAPTDAGDDETPFVPGVLVYVFGSTFKNLSGAALSLQGPQAQLVAVVNNLIYHDKLLMPFGGKPFQAVGIGFGFGSPRHYLANGVPFNAFAGVPDPNNPLPEPAFAENGTSYIFGNIIASRNTNEFNNHALTFKDQAAVFLDACGVYQGKIGSGAGFTPDAAFDNIGSGHIFDCNVPLLDAIAGSLLDLPLGGLVPSRPSKFFSGVPLNLKLTPVDVTGKKMNPSFGPSFPPGGISTNKIF